MPLCGIHFNTRIKPNISHIMLTVSWDKVLNNVNHAVTICTA